MRGAFEKERDRLSAQMADMRKDVKEEKERLKSDLNEAKNDLALKERELTESANILTTSVKRDISTTRFNALSQIRLGFNIEVQFTGF